LKFGTREKFPISNIKFQISNFKQFKTMNTKTKSVIIALITAFQVSVIPLAVADLLPVRAYGDDTIAGYSSKLTSSLLTPGQNVVFVVEKPDSSVVQIPAQADIEGIAETDLYGHQTKVAGTYRVSLFYPGSADYSPQNTFTVYPGSVSVTQSDMKSTSQMVSADGTEKTFVTVTLYDEYRNPIINHMVQLISSRPEDSVAAINSAVSDDSGRASFKITSQYPGISVFTALDATVNKILSARAEIVFYAPVKTESAIGGNYLGANMFQADVGQGTADALPGPVNTFEITGLPSTVKLNADQTVTITALDKAGNVAKNYTGTILFSTPDDEHALLPNNGEYTFKENDQGAFTFNLALRFTSIGKQTLQVFDKTNWKISGEKEVEVVPENAVVSAPTSATLAIKSPVDGAELGNSLVVITGQGDPNINLKVFDNDVKIGDSETDSDGFFSYQAQGLTSGSHVFYMMSETGDVSPSVTVQIDTIPPVLNRFEVSPDGVVKPGDQITVTAQSEPNLDSVKVRLQGAEQILSPAGDQPGTYTATMAAPAIEGSFPLDLILVDKMSNKTELLNQVMVQVSVPKETPPPTVKGVSGASGDSQVILTWYEVTGHDTEIQKYRIYYGTAYDKLDQTVETEKPVTSVTLNNLENDKQYFFAVKAIDAKGIESKDPSVTIALTPVAPVAETPAEEVTVTPIEEGTVTTTPIAIEATPAQNSVILSWQPFTGVEAYFYKIYFGLESGQYDDFILTSNNSTTVNVQDLIPGLKYYFAVAALGLSGKEISPLSQEISAAPGGAGYHQAPPTAELPGAYYTPPMTSYDLSKVPESEKTGPESVWLVLSSLVVAHTLYRLKRRALKS
jgi:hypothetical protein